MTELTDHHVATVWGLHDYSLPSLRPAVTTYRCWRSARTSSCVSEFSSRLVGAQFATRVSDFTARVPSKTVGANTVFEADAKSAR